MNRQELAKNYFLKGYNCTQAVVLAFKDYLNLDEETLIKISTPFGGGFSRLREVCGAFSGVCIVIGYKYSSTDPSKKLETYKIIQQLADEFKKVNGHLVCRNLLNLDHNKDNPVPTNRDAHYYSSRPCVKIIESAAAILEKYINDHPN